MNFNLRYLFLFAVLFLTVPVSAVTFHVSDSSVVNTTTDTLVAYFKTDTWNFNSNYKDNLQLVNYLNSFDSYTQQFSHFHKKLVNVKIVGKASPEGSYIWNSTLSQWRAEQLNKLIGSHDNIPQQIITSEFTGRDWATLASMVEADENVPYRKEVLQILFAAFVDTTAANKTTLSTLKETSSVSDNILKALKTLKGGVPYRYLYKKYFPQLRATTLHFIFQRIPYNGFLQALSLQSGDFLPQITCTPKHELKMQQQYVQHQIKQNTTQQQGAHKKFFMAIKSNLLYDALITPNLGVEFKLGEHYSVQGNWMYAWWKSDPSAWYHRTYGGDISVRRWIGKQHIERPLTGWHAGLYGQMLTYDFIWGKRGYLADRWSWGAGVEGGWSKAIGKRLNLDFSLNFGYLTGVYQEYIPQDGCYVWQATKNRHWIGPTKAEVSLVWLLGKW